MLNQKGISLIAVVAVTAILFCGFFAFIKMQERAKNTGQRARETVRAELLAAELLEFFRGLPTAEVVNYLRRNPVAPSPGAAACAACAPNCPAGCPYFLCSHINILDRISNRILNEDPMARLGSSVLDNPDPKRAPNRFYWVEVVDLVTLTPNKTFCNLPADVLFAAGAPNYGLATNERLQVSVGVTWYPAGSGELKRIVLSTIIPRVPS